MSFSWLLAVSALSGFLALSYEIVWYRAYSFASASTPTVFGMLLGAYLMGLAIGSMLSRRFCRDRQSSGGAAEMAALSGFVFFATILGYLVVPAFARLVTATSWIVSLGLVTLATTFLGAVLPLVSHFGISPDDRAGLNLSYVYLVNILGSSAGSLFTGFVLLDTLPIGAICGLLAVVGVALAAALLVASRRDRRGLLAVAPMAAVAAGVLLVTPALFDQTYERLLLKEKFEPEHRFTELVENRSGVIAVDPAGLVYGGGVYDGVFSTTLMPDRNGIVRAYGVGAMHPAPRTILEIGLASGSWAQVLINLPGAERMTVIEINPGYLELIARHPEVASLLRNPKVEMVIDDGRRWLLRHPDKRFDVIVMNTTWHWRAHATNLLSKEFFEIAKPHLAPGGILFFNTTSSADVQKTAATVFAHAIRVQNFLAVSDAPFTFDPDRWRRVLTETRIDGVPVLDLQTDAARRRLQGLMALPETVHRPPTPQGLEERASLLARHAHAGIVTDDNMLPEWSRSIRERVQIIPEH